MGSKLSTGHHVNISIVSVNDFTNCDAIFDTAAELYGINRETVCSVVQLKSKISADTQLSAWLQVQLKSTMNTLHAMGVLKCKLHQARAVVLLIFREGTDSAEKLEKLKDCLETMRFATGDFKLACHQHEQLTEVLHGLRRRKHDLEDKLGRIKAWSKAWNIALWIAKFGVTLLSVLIPVARVRAVVTAANNGAGGVIGLLQPLVDSHLASQQSSCEVERDLTAKILNEACFIFHRVNSARVLVDLLESQMELLARDAEFLVVAVEDEDLAVSMAMDKIKAGKAGDLVDSIESLENEVDCSCEDLRRAALTLLQMVTDQVSIYQLKLEI
ncbi:hypothetical protein IHE45_07G032700 [Dioscorea alata]|uniref:Uncharacterized protein n=1 Tax=Dioscorea alata TaxID=55571 RepID=A0ACB7VPX0_DIOAL|nr:hypothetical protein IHE45_07G032700 [Dioscorea alata]